MRKLGAKAALEFGNVFLYIRYRSWVCRFRRFSVIGLMLQSANKEREIFVAGKIFDPNPMYWLVTDKLMVRQYVKMIGSLTFPRRTSFGLVHRLSRYLRRCCSQALSSKLTTEAGEMFFIGDAPLHRAQINQQVMKWLTHPYEYVSDGRMGL